MDFVSKSISDPSLFSCQYLVVPVFEKSGLAGITEQLNKSGNGAIEKLVKRGDIEGKVGESLLLPSFENGKAERVLLLGAGAKDGISEDDFKKVLGELVRQLKTTKIKTVGIGLDELTITGRDKQWLTQQLVIAIVVGSYRYQRTLSKPAPASAINRVTLLGASDSGIKNAIEEATAIGTGINTARELGNLPANICTPSYLANEARAMSRKYRELSVSVLEEKQMQALGMGALLSVTAGTDQPAKLIVMEYKGAAKASKPFALVGKGITFDSGGISIKPAAKMDEMKFDMCGAASVFGTMTTVAELGLPINVVAIVAAAENLPNGNATKPGDVVTSMSGQTIEVLNTDAEGRLVLCDALTFTERYDPQSVIDIATLTGACVVALGSHATGLFSNSDEFAAELLSCGVDAADRAWQMPLWDVYQGSLKSNFADLANVGGPEAGSVTAACFLSRFTKKFRWAHLDIAGTAWDGGANKGATGRPVALLSRYLIKQVSAKPTKTAPKAPRARKSN